MLNTYLYRMVILITLLGFVSLSKSAMSNESDSHNNQPLIAEQGHQIVVNIPENKPPFHFTDDENKLTGYLVDVWQDWAKQYNSSVVFTTKPIASPNVSVYSRFIDEQTSVNYRSLLSIKNDISIELKVSVNKAMLAVNTLQDLNALAIGVVQGSYSHELIEKYQPQLTLRLFDDHQALYQAAVERKLLAFTDFTKERASFSQHKSLNTLYPAYKQITYQKLALAIDVDENPLLADAHIERVVSNIREYFSQQAALASVEKLWFGMQAPREQLVVAFDQKASPYIHFRQGKAVGFFAELWQLWGQFNNIDVDIVKVDKQELINQMQNGHADVFMSFEDKALSPSISPKYLFYNTNIQFFLRSNANHQAEHEVDGKRIAISKNAPFLTQFQQKYPDINFVLFDDLKDALLPVNRQKIDGVVGEYQTTYQLLTKSKQAHLFLALSTHVQENSTHLLLHEDKSQLLNMLTEGFKTIPNERLIALENKWLHKTDTPSYFMQKSLIVNLSEEQKQWLDQHQTIKVGMVANWSPMESVDKHGDLVGINPDFFHLIESRIGMRFQYNIYDTWTELLKASKQKEVDLLASISITDERKQTLNFTEPYWNMPWGILHPITGGKNVQLSDFNHKKVAILAGMHVATILNKNFPDIQLVEVDATEKAYSLLQQGQVSALISSLAPASELLKRESLITMGISVIDNLSVEKEQIGIRNDWPELVDIINTALLSITELEKKNILDKWFNVEITTGYEKNVVIKLAIQIGVFILIVIAVIIFWNRRLYDEIKQRKILEEKMKYMATHDELTGLANRTLLTERINSSINFHKRQNLTLAVLFIDLDGFKHINDNYGHDVGDELLIELTNRLQNCVRESDTVARFGGDEFVLLLTGLHDKKEAAFIAEKALKVIRKPVELSAATVAVSCSIGIASYPNDGDSDTELLKIADTLMYRVKSHGKNHYLFNSP